MGRATVEKIVVHALEIVVLALLGRHRLLRLHHHLVELLLAGGVLMNLNVLILPKVQPAHGVVG
jgi:hypothetical protein